MDADRWSCLAVKAYAAGLLKFTEKEREDSRWKIRENLLLLDVERKDLIATYKVLHTHDAVAAQYAGGDDVVKHYRDAAFKHYKEIEKLLLPYDNKSSTKVKDVITSMSEEWKKVFGDPNDPKVKAKMDKLINSWRGK